MNLMGRTVNRSDDINKLCGYSIYRPLLFCLIIFTFIYLMIYVLFNRYILPIDLILKDLNKDESVFFLINLIEQTSLYILSYLVIINIFCLFMIIKLRKSIYYLKYLKSMQDRK
jgi:hypothetical protein